MTNHKTLNVLTKIIYDKYNSRFWNCLPEWKEYVASLNILWDTKKPKPKDSVFIECPWSVHNSPIGNINGKAYLSIPNDLANKILLFGVMPDRLTENR